MAATTSPNPSSRGGEKSKNYSSIVLDHYRHPRNFGKLEKPTHWAFELNPVCGDEIKVYLSVRNGSASGGKITEIKFEARGCALSIAAASVLSERIVNQELRIGDVAKIGKTDLEKWLAIKISAARESCVTLALNAIKKSTPTFLPLTKGEGKKG